MSFLARAVNLETTRSLRVVTYPFKPGALTSFGARHLHTLLPKPPNLQVLKTTSDMQHAREWADKFKDQVISRNLVDLTFARSSGPGGQNVNKVNTKASVRCSIKEIWIPPWAQERLRASSSYVASSDTIHVTSTRHRSQSQNVDDCLSKLHSIILEAATGDVKNETSDAQKARVRHFKAVEDKKRREEKSNLKKKREFRKGRRGLWD